MGFWGGEARFPRVFRIYQLEDQHETGPFSLLQVMPYSVPGTLFTACDPFPASVASIGRTFLALQPKTGGRSRPPLGKFG